MARTNYPDECKRDAVALYRDTARVPRSCRSLASSGVHEATLTAWWEDAGVSIRRGRSAAAPAGAGGSERPEQELARLRAEVKALRAEQAKLSSEREILRKAAKYFAGETNW